MQSHSIETAQERAALYTAGALSADEQLEFEDHLKSGCVGCQAAVDSFAAVGVMLGEAATPRRPRAALRKLVQDAVAQVAQGSGAIERDGVRFVRGQFVPWEKSGERAPQIKRLNHDSTRGCQSVLVRMKPGDTYPRHRHADIEEVYLIEGDLSLNGITMGAGDYCRAEAGSVHTELSTQHGCTFIVFASDHDEILAG